MGRKTALVAAAVVAMAASATTGQAAAPKQAESYACNPSGTLAVLWHPKGHEQIASLGFPAWKTPHVEFYRGNRPGTDTYLIYAGAKGQGPIPPFTTNAYCLPGEKKTPFLQPKGLQRLKGESKLTCRFGKAGRFLATKLGPGSYRIQAVLGKRLVVDAMVKKTGSFVRYARAACKQSAVPD